MIQRGNDRRPCFFAEVDCIRCLRDLREIARREGCAVRPYVPTNHVYLLMAPGAVEAQRRNHRELVMQAVDPDETDTIRRCVQHQRIGGSDRLRQAIEHQLGRKLGPKKTGRPKKATSNIADLVETRL